MSLDSEKLKIINTQANPASSQTIAGGSSISIGKSKSKPINFKAQDAKVEEKSKNVNSKVIKFVNSEEFKGLTSEAQLKTLKEQFMPNATEKQLQQTITLAKESVQVSGSSSETEKTLPTLEPSGKESDVEKAAFEYLNKNNLKDIDIDGLRSLLASKANKTPEEQKLFDNIQNAFAQNNKNVSDKKNEPLISAKDMLSDEWINKKPMEKLDDMADKYFSKTSEKYNDMADFKQKRRYIKNNIRELAASLSSNNKRNLTVGDYARVPELLNALNAKGMTVEDYNKLSKADKQELYRNYQKETLKELKGLVPESVRQGDDWHNKSADQKLMVYADAFLSKNDPDYENLSPKDRENYIRAKSNELISKFKPNWGTIEDEEKEAFLADIVITVDTVLENDMSLDEYQNLSFRERLNLKRAYKESHGYKITKADETYSQIIADFITKNDGKEPTINDLINEIQSNPSISDADKKQLLESLHLKKDFNDGKDKKVSLRPSYDKIALARGVDVKNVLDRDFKVLEKAEQPKEKIKFLTKMYCRADGNEEIIAQIRDRALSMGLSEEDVNAALKASNAHQDAMVRGVRNNDAKMYNAGFNMSADLGDKKTCKVAAYNVTKVLSGEAKEAASVNVVNNHQEYIDDFSKGVNDFEPDPVSFSKSLLSRDDVSNAGKSLFTKSVIETSPTPERQLEYGRSFAEIENPAVTEGLAAASKSVDSSVRSQYDSYVDSAMKNYPPEQQAAIVAARQSGEISKATLAQNTPPAASSNSPETRSAQSQMTDSVSKNEQSVVSQGRTTVSSNPAVAPAASKTVSQTHKTSPSQAVRTDKDAQVMQQKKEALLDKISSYESEKAERIKQRETQKLQKAEKQQEAAIEDETLDTQSVSKTDTTETEELQLSQDEQETLKAVIEDIFQKNSVSAAYAKLLDKIGEAGKDKFLEVFAAKGRDMDVRSFAENYKNNSDTIIKLINYCQSESLKFDLLKMLPSTSISELVSTQKLSPTDFDRLVRENKVESKIILEYINKNKGSMSVQEMKKYLSFLSLADRNALFDILKNTKGSDEWLQAQQENMRTVATDSPEYQEEVAEAAGLNGMNTLPGMDDGISIGSNKVSMRGQYNKMKTRGPFFLNA